MKENCKECSQPNSDIAKSELEKAERTIDNLCDFIGARITCGRCPAFDVCEADDVCKDGLKKHFSFERVAK
jgi:hypothetical protein